MAKEVFPGIFQGPESSAKDAIVLARLGVTHVLSVGAQGPASADSLVCKRVSLKDASDGSADLPRALELAEPIITEVLETRKRTGKGAVLVHCKAGLSRSPALIAGYLAKNCGIKSEDSLAHMREATGRRIQPNVGFLETLQRLDQQYLGQSK